MTAKRKDTAPPIGDHLLTLREAAEVLRLSTRTVREYILRGEIEGRIIGGPWRFRTRPRKVICAAGREFLGNSMRLREIIVDLIGVLFDSHRPLRIPVDQVGRTAV